MGLAFCSACRSITCAKIEVHMPGMAFQYESEVSGLML